MNNNSLTINYLQLVPRIPKKLKNTVLTPRRTVISLVTRPTLFILNLLGWFRQVPLLQARLGDLRFDLRGVLWNRSAVRFLMLNWRDPENPLAGGAERVTLGYLSALAERGHEVAWFAFDFPGAARETRIRNVQIVRGGGKGSAIALARRWTRAQPRFDLVIDQHHGIPWLAPWWCGTNCVAYIHEVLGPIWTAFYPFPVSALGQAQERWTHWLYRKIPFWTACESTRRELLAHGVRKVRVIPYGVETVALPELPPKQITAPLRLVVVSRLAPNKRIDHAIRAAHELTKLNIPVELTIVGTGWEETRLKDLARGLGLADKVRFAGSLSETEKDQHLRECHLLLHTSQREGWGLNVIEANAMGTPAAVYPVAGLIESTLDNQTGVVSQLESPESLAARIADLVKGPDEYARLRLNAWERAKTFHWSRVLPVACDWLESMGSAPRVRPK
jgi:glycosyltransferase involved in cell wall biosynthesis